MSAVLTSSPNCRGHSITMHRTTRADALAAGELVDVSQLAAEAGFSEPMAMTAEVWADCCAWDADDNARKGMVTTADDRAWDVVWLAWMIRRNRRGRRADFVQSFQVYRVPRPGKAQYPRRVYLQIHSLIGDNGEPVFTITHTSEG